MDCDIPTTPPRAPQACYASLLTPPPSGGFDKSFTYQSLEAEHQTSSNPISPTGFKRMGVRLQGSGKDEQDESFFSDQSISEPRGSVTPSEDQSIAWDTSSTISTLTELSDLSESEEEDTTCKPLDYFAAFTFSQQCHAIEGPFNFMGLPLKVRNRVYSLLLTIPAIISVRQNRTRTYNENNAYLFAETRKLLPGVAFALAKLVVDGTKFHYSRYRYANAAILRVNHKIHQEAKEVMYGGNDFELKNLNRETSPTVDFSIPLFPRGYPRFIRKMTMRAKSIYGFQHLLKNAGHADLKNHYRGLETLTLILELESVHRGYGKKLSRNNGEHWITYVKRVHNVLQLELFDCPGIFKSVPIWINMKVLMTGDHYIEDGHSKDEDAMEIDDEDELKEQHIKAAVAEAFELFKKGSKK